MESELTTDQLQKTDQPPPCTFLILSKQEEND